MNRISRFAHVVAALALLFAVLPSTPIAQAQPETLLINDMSVTMLGDIYPGWGDSILSPSFGPVAAPLGNNVVFFASSPEYGLEPWITNGTPEGTKLIKDTFPGTTGVYKFNYYSMVNPVAWNGKVLFVGQGKNASGSLVPQLWVTDGTAAGTNPLFTMEFPIYQFAAGTQGVMFTAYRNKGVHNIDEATAWWTDGTPQGTRKLYSAILPIDEIEIQPVGSYGYVRTANRMLLKINSIEPQYTLTLADRVEKILGTVNGLLFFTRETSVYGQELWQTDGTAAGTVMVADMSPGNSGTQIFSTLVYGSKLAFIARVYTGSYHVFGIFSTTGKAGGISLIDSSKTAEFHDLQLQGETLFYRRTLAYDFINTKWELWYVNGPTTSKRICPTCLFNPDLGIGGLPGAIVFSASDTAGSELWYSNFNDAETHRITGYNGNYLYTRPADILSMDGYVFFTGTTEEKGREPHVYRKVSSPITAGTDTFTAMRDVSHKFDVLANDSHQTGLPLNLVDFDPRGTRGGWISRDDRGTPNDRTDDRLVYMSALALDVDEFHYWVEDTAGNQTTGRVSIKIVPQSPMPPEDILFVPWVKLFEDMGQFNTIGVLQVEDPTPYDDHTCTINTPDSPFIFVNNPVLGLNRPLDYETHPDGYVLNVTCTDEGGLSLTKDVVIPVENVNEPPELTLPADQNTVEDSPQQWQVSWTDPENNVNSVMADPIYGTATVTGCLSSTCTVQYQPAADFVGTDTITIKATDSGGLIVEEVMSVTVTSGNDDPPVMRLLGTIVRSSVIEAHQIGIDGIAAGPYETGPVTIAASSDNPAMLADLAVDYTEGPEGVLTFTLHPEEGTEALVIVTLNDGVNEAEYTFKVLVTDNPPLYLPLVGR